MTDFTKFKGEPFVGFSIEALSVLNSYIKKNGNGRVDPINNLEELKQRVSTGQFFRKTYNDFGLIKKSRFVSRAIQQELLNLSNAQKYTNLNLLPKGDNPSLPEVLEYFVKNTEKLQSNGKTVEKKKSSKAKSEAKSEENYFQPQNINIGEKFNPVKCTLASSKAYKLVDVENYFQRYGIYQPIDASYGDLCSILRSHWTKYMTDQLIDLFSRNDQKLLSGSELVKLAEERGINYRGLSEDELVKELIRYMIDNVLTNDAINYGFGTMAESVVDSIMTGELDIKQLSKKELLAILMIGSRFNRNLLQFVVTEEISEEMMNEFDKFQKSMANIREAVSGLSKEDAVKIATKLSRESKKSSETKSHNTSIPSPTNVSIDHELISYLQNANKIDSKYDYNIFARAFDKLDIFKNIDPRGNYILLIPQDKNIEKFLTTYNVTLEDFYKYPYLEDLLRDHIYKIGEGRKTIFNILNENVRSLFGTKGKFISYKEKDGSRAIKFECDFGSFTITPSVLTHMNFSIYPFRAILFGGRKNPFENYGEFLKQHGKKEKTPEPEQKKDGFEELLELKNINLSDFINLGRQRYNSFSDENKMIFNRLEKVFVDNLNINKYFDYTLSSNSESNRFIIDEVISGKIHAVAPEKEKEEEVPEEHFEEDKGETLKKLHEMTGEESDDDLDDLYDEDVTVEVPFEFSSNPAQRFYEFLDQAFSPSERPKKMKDIWNTFLSQWDENVDSLRSLILSKTTYERADEVFNKSLVNFLRELYYGYKSNPAAESVDVDPNTLARIQTAGVAFLVAQKKSEIHSDNEEDEESVEVSEDFTPKQTESDEIVEFLRQEEGLGYSVEFWNMIKGELEVGKKYHYFPPTNAGWDRFFGRFNLTKEAIMSKQKTIEILKTNIRNHIVSEDNWTLNGTITTLYGNSFHFDISSKMFGNAKILMSHNDTIFIINDVLIYNEIPKKRVSVKVADIDTERYVGESKATEVEDLEEKVQEALEKEESEEEIETPVEEPVPEPSKKEYFDPAEDYLVGSERSTIISEMIFQELDIFSEYNEAESASYFVPEDEVWMKTFGVNDINKIIEIITEDMEYNRDNYLKYASNQTYTKEMIKKTGKIDTLGGLVELDSKNIVESVRVGDDGQQMLFFIDVLFFGEVGDDTDEEGDFEDFEAFTPSNEEGEGEGVPSQMYDEEPVEKSSYSYDEEDDDLDDM